jgi:hypothetical protein
MRLHILYCSTFHSVGIEIAAAAAVVLTQLGILHDLLLVVTQSVMSHMIDIVDSFDVQVAYIKNSTMVSRSAPAYHYWDSKIGKSNSSRAYVLSYTNPTSLCQSSYSPHVIGSAVTEDSCAFTTKSRT